MIEIPTFMLPEALRMFTEINVLDVMTERGKDYVFVKIPRLWSVSKKQAGHYDIGETLNGIQAIGKTYGEAIEKLMELMVNSDLRISDECSFTSQFVKFLKETT
jgi:hypothetical protein